MAALDGRVVIVTGAGRGLGRAYAIHLAAEGARLVVNDVGAAPDGTGRDVAVAQEVADEIVAAGGDAVANGDDVADWDGGRRLVEQAIGHFGRLDVLVSNAGIVRGAPLAAMGESDWDDVIGVHLKGHFVPLRFAAAHWRWRSKDGEAVDAAVVTTSSIGGLLPGLPRQANYVAAKAGIAGLTMAAAGELSAYGVRVNAVAPNARTRLTLAQPDSHDAVQAPDAPDEFDLWDPLNVAPLIAYLSAPGCPFSGAVFHVGGREIGLFDGWSVPRTILSEDGPWTVADLQRDAKQLLQASALASSPQSLQELVAGLYARHQR